MWYYGESFLTLDRRGFYGLVVRFLLSFFAWMLMYYTVEYLPLGVFLAIQNSSPLFTAIIGYLMLKEIL
jgi:drug/metabolite transporter (DMT)-like permease